MTQSVRPLARAATRPAAVPAPHHYLMCRPTYFDVSYAINVWMDPSRPVRRELAIRQWERLVAVYESLGHQVDLIDPVPGLPDMVFAANGGFVLDGTVLVARFRHAERADESPLYRAWFEANGSRQVAEPELVTEGEGDLAFVDPLILCGTGFRTDPATARQAQRLFGRPVITVELADPRFYHLDTAFCALDDRTVAYYPSAFSADSQQVLDWLFPDAIRADEADALALGLNAVCDGRNVVLSEEATGLAGELAARGFQPVPVDISELRRAGGGPKCCTLELRGLTTRPAGVSG